MSEQRPPWDNATLDEGLFTSALEDADAEGEETLVFTMPIDDLVATIADGRYEILRIIGEGGMATVYEALDKHTGTSVAMKLLTQNAADGKFAERFQQEIDLISQLDSPHIVKVHGAGTLADGRPYLTEELLLGKTLRDVIHEDGPLPPSRAARIIVQTI